MIYPTIWRLRARVTWPSTVSSICNSCHLCTCMTMHMYDICANGMWHMAYVVRIVICHTLCLWIPCLCLMSYSMIFRDICMPDKVSVCGLEFPYSLCMHMLYVHIYIVKCRSDVACGMSVGVTVGFFVSFWCTLHI